MVIKNAPGGATHGSQVIIFPPNEVPTAAAAGIGDAKLIASEIAIKRCEMMPIYTVY